jgi:hypothetical protein
MRGKGEVNPGTNHVGFRCVKDEGLENRAQRDLKSNTRWITTK